MVSGEVRVIPPLEAITAAAVLPARAVLAAVSFSTLVPVPGAAMPAGVKLAVTPAGTPVVASVTGALKPPLLVALRLTVAEPPAMIESELAAPLN